MLLDGIKDVGELQCQDEQCEPRIDSLCGRPLYKNGSKALM